MDEGLDVEDNSLLVNVVNFPGSESEEQGAETLLDIGSHDHSYAIAAGTTAGHPSMRSDDKEEKDNNDLGAGEGVGEDSVVVGKRKSVMRRDELLNGDDNGVYVILPEGLDSEEEESFIVSIAMEGKEEKQLPQQQQQQQQEAEPSSLPTNQPPAAIPTKWDIYGQRIVKLARTLARKSKTVLRKDGDTAELFKYQIYTLKRRIRSILLEISQLNAADRQFPSLLEGTEAEDMINVETVVCSKCGLSDEINNDILLCDKVNCCRAYHQNCLEPRVDVSLIKDEPYWFCWVCDTVNNCLSWLNKKLGTEFDRPEAVFPEVSSESNNEELMRTWASKFPLISYDPEVKAPAVEHKKRRPRNDDSDESEGSTEPDLPLDYLAPARKKKRRKSTPAPSRVAYKSRMHDPGYFSFSYLLLPKLRAENTTMSRQAFIRELDLRWYRLPAVEKAVYAERERVEGKDKVLEEVQAMLREIQGDPMEQQGDSASGRNVPHARMMISGEHKYQCGLCGKGFKTEGGHKYHTTNVCIVNSMTVNH